MWLPSCKAAIFPYRKLAICFVVENSEPDSPSRVLNPK
jgi:hypothetical protein